MDGSNKVQGLACKLYDICESLDSQKLIIVEMLPGWVNTSNATDLIQAMAHVDSAIRILESRHGELSKALIGSIRGMKKVADDEPRNPPRRR